MVGYRHVALAAVVLLVPLGIGGGLVSDVDGDGIDSLSELQAATDPLTADTDGDWLADDREYAFGSDPTIADTDGDGLNDFEERYGTSHGLKQGSAEYRYVVDWEQSDPRSTDTDDDGIPDGQESEVGLDPTSADSDGDGLSDSREVDGPLDPTNPDTDGDNLLDGWEVEGVTDKGAPLPNADPLHKDMYVQVMYLRNTPEKAPSSVFRKSKEWFAEMPVQNPDGETGIRVRFYDNDEYAGPVNATIDEWVRDDGSTTEGVSGFMAMREFYNREYMGPRTGSYFLVVFAGEDVPVRGAGNAGGTKTSIVRPWPVDGPSERFERRKAHTVTHELLHNIVREVRPSDAYDECNGASHTCEGFLSYENDYYLSDRSAGKLNREGFARPEYREQMNATDCEDTIYDPDLCED